jgi:hypothetical protein
VAETVGGEAALQRAAAAVKNAMAKNAMIAATMRVDVLRHGRGSIARRPQLSVATRPAKQPC